MTLETFGSRSDSGKQRFMDRLMPVAEKIREELKIHPRILLAQAAHESRWGMSALSVEANNLFGMTGDSWVAQGRPVYWVQTHEWSPKDSTQIKYWDKPGDIVSMQPSHGGTDLIVKRPFRHYSTWDESCWDWGNMIAKAPRYAKTYEKAISGDIPAFAEEAKAAGYATDPRYPAKLAAYAREPLFADLA